MDRSEEINEGIILKAFIDGTTFGEWRAEFKARYGREPTDFETQEFIKSLIPGCEILIPEAEA